MKIAYLLSEYPTLGHTYLLREVRQLRTLGWDIQVISIRKPDVPPGSLSDAEKAERHATWYVLGSSVGQFLAAHAATLLTRPRQYLRGIAASRRLTRLRPRRNLLAVAYFSEAILAGHRLQKAHYKHVHSVYSTTVGLILAETFEAGLSMTIHGPDEFVSPEAFGMAEKVRAARFVSSISYFGKSQIMLWSDPQDWHKLEVTPLGIDSTGWVPAEFRENPTQFNLIAVGRLAPVKGCPLLLEALALLIAQGRKVRLTLVGDGPEKSRLTEEAVRLKIADSVVFAGWKSQQELRELYRNSDVCLLSSFAEGIPVVFMEAMALGVPCIAPRITGIPELIRHGIDGLLVTPANVEELTAAIAEMMDKPQLRRQMALSCPSRVADKFNLMKNVTHLSGIFRRYVPDDDVASTG